jgi:D-alanyl-lipoteichoic acid acyltransferase DltB (MBOAT superfamily)
MLFNSIDFLLFFPCVIAGYYLLPQKLRYLWLLAASYYFYGNWNPVYIWLLFGCTAFTYLAGLLITRTGDAKPLLTRFILGISIAGMVSVLVFYKYLGFSVNCINSFLRLLHANQLTWKPDILLPVGISFYTLQAMGYLIDVYRHEIAAEKNFFRYALFISFFPQLVAGPIERSRHLLAQLKSPAKFDFDNLQKGLLLIFWGLFCKMVIADRAAVIVDRIYDNPDTYAGFYIAYATVLFALQIYCDFYGYSTIARGTALTMGISLTDTLFFQKRQGVLAQMAHFPVLLVPGLSVHPARRQPQRKCP